MLFALNGESSGIVRGDAIVASCRAYFSTAEDGPKTD